MPLRVPPWLRAGVWLLGRGLRERSTVVCALALTLGWALAMGLGDLGITGGFRPSDGLFYQLAFLAMGVAGGLGSWVLGRNGWLWAPLTRGQRAAAEATLLLTGGALALGLAWLPALVSGAPLPWALAGAGLLHISALAHLVSRCPTPEGLRPLLLVSLLWWIPVLLRSEPEPLASLGRFLSGPIPMPDAGSIQTRTRAPVDMAPAIAFALAAWLLTPRTPRS